MSTIKLPPLPPIPEKQPNYDGGDDYWTESDFERYATAYAEEAVRQALAEQASDAMSTHNDAIKAAAQVCIDIARQYDPQNSQEHALASELYAAARVIRRHEKAGPARLPSPTEARDG